ncbi:polysaccharide biosynthesis family protein, partial [Bacteroides fragilis str. S6L5]
MNFFNLVLPLLVTPYLYRILSPETIGQVEYSTSIFGYFSLFGVLGIY